MLGTTGLSPAAKAGIDADARAAGVRILYAPNFAIGAVLMMQMAEQAHALLPDAHIVELHTDTKRDAPSGTSLATAARMGGDVPIASIRLPGLIAHQEVIFGGLGGDPHDPPRHRPRGRRSCPACCSPCAASTRFPQG